MELNDIYEKIIESGGECFKTSDRPPCEHCPFKKDCLEKMILLAKNIPSETRVNWALDGLVEKILLGDDDE
jgi:hypothetical protein